MFSFLGFFGWFCDLGYLWYTEGSLEFYMGTYPICDSDWETPMRSDYNLGNGAPVYIIYGNGIYCG